MSATPHIVLAGGGSAGYLYPGLALAEEMAARVPSAVVTIVGTGVPFERHTVRAHGFQYAALPCQTRIGGPLQAVRFVTENVAGYWAARWFLREQRASLVVGLGGCASGAMVRAAQAMGVPTILLEQNALPGCTTRRLAASARLVCVGFEEVRAHLPVQAPILVTGNPVCGAFLRAFSGRSAEPVTRRWLGPTEHWCACVNEDPDRRPRSRQLVILGGSEHASTLNAQVPRALMQIPKALADWRVVHQTGNGQLRATTERYQQAGIDAITVTYIDQLAAVLRETDLVVCRAGGNQLAELAVAGVPALLLPDPDHPAPQQLANASVFQATGACQVIDESTLEKPLSTTLASKLARLLADTAMRRHMAAAMRERARPDAGAQIAAAMAELVEGSYQPIPLAA